MSATDNITESVFDCQNMLFTIKFDGLGIPSSLTIEEVDANGDFKSVKLDSLQYATLLTQMQAISNRNIYTQAKLPAWNILPSMIQQP